MAPPLAAGTMEALLSCRVIFVVRGSSARDALDAAFRVVEVGGRAVEITFTVPQAAEIIARLREGELPLGTWVGAGTVIEPVQAALAADAGAQFLVSPGLDSEIAAEADARGLPLIPGVFSASEVMAALRRGIDTVKLFPAMPAGPELLRALRGPFPSVRFVPSGGVRRANAAAWLQAGAAAIGVGVATSRIDPIEIRELLDAAAASDSGGRSVE